MMISVRFVCLCGFGYWILWFHAWCSSMPDFTYLFCSWWVSVHCYPSICFIYGVHHLMSDCNFEATGMVPEQTKEATRPKWDGEWCLHHASKAVFGLLSPWPLTFLLQLICCDTVGKYFVWLKGFLQPILATCDLNLWPPDPRSWSFHALAACTTRANLHQYWFIRFQNIAFTSLVMDHGYYKWLHSTNVLNNNNNNEDHKYSSLTAGARHVKPRRTTHCTVLPPCHLNYIIPEPLLICSDSFMVAPITITIMLVTTKVTNTGSKKHYHHDLWWWNASMYQ